jgi:hypothetical protein
MLLDDEEIELHTGAVEPWAQVDMLWQLRAWFD